MLAAALAPAPPAAGENDRALLLPMAPSRRFSPPLPAATAATVTAAMAATAAPVAVYETAHTRRFWHGRTEAVRSLSAESAAFVAAMLDPGTCDADFPSAVCAVGVSEPTPKSMEATVTKRAADSTRAALLRAALVRHRATARRSASAMGIDRHIFGLARVAADARAAAAAAATAATAAAAAAVPGNRAGAELEAITAAVPPAWELPAVAAAVEAMEALAGDPVFRRAQRWVLSTSSVTGVPDVTPLADRPHTRRHRGRRGGSGSGGDEAATGSTAGADASPLYAAAVPAGVVADRRAVTRDAEAVTPEAVPGAVTDEAVPMWAGYAPAVPDGYGCCYAIDDGMLHCVASCYQGRRRPEDGAGPGLANSGKVPGTDTDSGAAAIGRAARFLREFRRALADVVALLEADGGSGCLDRLPVQSKL
ncbi:unnamed protein product [Phaeothamnion confervicola]